MEFGHVLKIYECLMLEVLLVYRLSAKPNGLKIKLQV